MQGSRVTDAVEFFRQREEHRHAVHLVRHRVPDARRWRAAMARMSGTVGVLRGRDRELVEEPLREVMLDLCDRSLRTEVVLDARRSNVDWDRGEVLAPKTFGDLRRATFLTGIDVHAIRSHVAFDEDFFAPVDVAGIVLVGRSYADAYRRRAHRLALELPLVEDSLLLTPRQQGIAAQVDRDDRESRRWAALAKSMLDESL